MLAAFLRLPIRKPFTIELRQSGIQFRVRTAMDIWIVKETCLDRQYERASVAIADGWSVLDIGAGLGDFAIEVAKTHPRSTVYAYEPFPESFTLLQANLRLNRVENVRVFPYAIGARDGTMQLHFVSSEPVQHTTALGDAPRRDGLSVPSVTLDQVFADLGLSRCDYLKADCEGAEYEIFFNADASTLRKIKHVCLEYHDGVKAFSHRDLVRLFAANGFQTRRTPNPVHRHLGLLHAMNPRI